MKPSRFDGFTQQEKATLFAGLKALVTTGGGEQPIMGGTLPPAMTGAEPVNEGTKMTQTKKDIAGATPAVGASTSEGPPKWRNDPGHEDVSAIAQQKVGTKPEYKPTVDLDEEDDDDEEAKALKRSLRYILTQKVKNEEDDDDDDDEAVKGLVRALIRKKAKRDDDDDDDEAVKSLTRSLIAKAKKQDVGKWEELQEAWRAGRKAEEALRREAGKREEELAALKEELGDDATGGVPTDAAYAPQQQIQPTGSVTPAVPTASGATGLKEGAGVRPSGGAVNAVAQGSLPKTRTQNTTAPTDPSAMQAPVALQPYVSDATAFDDEGGGYSGPTPTGQPVEGGTLPTGMGGGANVASAPEFQEEDDDEAVKALRNVVGGLVDKYFGKSFPNGVVEFQKEFDDVLAQVSQPKGGSENFTNVALPGQPPGKISAVPGKSGSSGVFRADTGKGIGQDEVFARARKNPASTLETEANVPIGTYDTPTHLTTGGGYQPALLRNAPTSTFRGRRFEPNMSKSYKDYMNISDSDDTTEKRRVAKKSLPILKQLSANNTISEADFEKLVREGKIVDSLVKPIEKQEETALIKHLKRVYK